MSRLLSAFLTDNGGRASLRNVAFLECFILATQWTTSKRNAIVLIGITFLRISNRLLFVMETSRIFWRVGKKSSFIIQISFGYQDVKGKGVLILKPFDRCTILPHKCIIFLPSSAINYIIFFIYNYVWNKII